MEDTMIVRMLGNLSVDGCEYEDQKFYDVNEDFVKKNAQNVLVQSKFSEGEKEMFKKWGIVKAGNTKALLESPANKMMDGKDTKKK